MKTPHLSRAVFVTASLLTFAACGGGGGSDNPDAQVGDDDVPDAAESNCIASTVGTLDISDNGLPDYILWDGPLDADFGDGGNVDFQIEFYADIAPTLAATFDLSAAPQDNYATCAVCLRAFSYDADGNFVRQFFQSAGSITVDVDPLTGGVLDATVTDLQMVEVEIDGSFNSTPVPDGMCSSVATADLAGGPVPNDWTCADNTYNDGTNCDCACGVPDPDCDIANAPVVGCAGPTDACIQGVCTATCDVLGGTGCTTGTCGFDTATRDLCYSDATLFDPATLGQTCGAGPIFCNVAATIATGICDGFVANDSVCREACDDATDCTNAGDICSPIVGAKGLCITPPANDTCQTAIALTVGTPVTGTTVGGASNYNAGLQTCTGFSQAGSDVAYQVTLGAAQAITVTVDQAPDFDPSISIVGPGTAAVCDANPIVCLAGADAGGTGASETFNFTTTTAGDYFVIVDSFGSGGGTFQLTVANTP